MSPNNELNSKLRLICDGEGGPVHLRLTARSRADSAQARQRLEPYVAKGCAVIADREGDANRLREWLNAAKATPCVSPRKKRKLQLEYDTDLYKTRNIIERMFNQLKEWRQLRLRSLRGSKTFLVAAHIAEIVIWRL